MKYPGRIPFVQYSVRIFFKYAFFGNIAYYKRFITKIPCILNCPDTRYFYQVSGLRFLVSDYLLAVIHAALGANMMGSDKFAAARAFDKSGCNQFVVVCTSLVSARL